MESWWRLLRLCHLGMMPEKRTQWKYDPSRAIALDVADICVDGRDDLPVPPGYSDVGGWRNGVGQDGRAFDRRRCNNIDRGSSGNKARTLHGIPWPGKPVAGEPLRHVSPRALAVGTGQRQRLRGTLETALVSDLTKVAILGPCRFQRQGSFFPARL